MGSPGPAGHCGACGYDVRGLPSRICPECGSDLDRVGIRQGTAAWNRRMAYSAAVLVAFTLLCIGGGAASMAIAERIWPPIRLIERDISLLHPRSGAYFGIRIEIRRIDDGSSRGSAGLTAVFLRNRDESLGPALRVNAVSGAGAAPSIDLADFDAWVVDNGLDYASDQLAAEMEFAYRAMLRHLGDQSVVLGDVALFGDTRGSMGWRPHPRNELLPVGIGMGWFLIWAVGGWFVARRVDRYFARA